MKTLLISLFTFQLLFTTPLFSQTFKQVAVGNRITEVQPMTGIVLWQDNDRNQKDLDAISLEYSYMKYNDIVKEKEVYDWTELETVLDDIASRNHQAIIRFYFVYPKDAPLRDGKTTVPDYIKNLSDYTEFKGTGDGHECYYPDWRHNELQNFALDFYTEFANKYDKDPRLAFLQTGFGLWAEYHTSDGKVTIDGKTYKESAMVGICFPSKEFQTKFLTHLNAVMVNTPWSISIDAADPDYTPMEENAALRNLGFGLFDDSFMSEEHDEYNKLNWQFFGTDRYKTTPAGGEFNYYTTADQKGVLDPNGWRGRTYEQAAQQFHISYMIGNDQPEYRPMSRIKEAGMASGYKFKIDEFLVSESASKVKVRNIGIAPIYYNAFVTVNGIRATESLKGLSPGETKEYLVQSGGGNPILTIGCDRLLSGQVIQFEGNSATGISDKETNNIQVIARDGILSVTGVKEIDRIKLTDLSGKTVIESIANQNEIPLKNLSEGVYIVTVSSGRNIVIIKKICYRR